MLSPTWTMITTSCGNSCHGRLVMSCDTLPLRVAAIRKAGVIACVRAQSAGIALDMARAALDGGLNVLEVTMTTPSAQLAITKLVEEYPSALIGAGTVLSLADADLARAAGAKFLISPVTIENLIGSHRDGPMLVIPGAITPTEVFNAYNHGASLVKFRATVRKEISQVPLDVDFDLLKVGGPSSGSCGGNCYNACRRTAESWKMWMHFHIADAENEDVFSDCGEDVHTASPLLSLYPLLLMGGVKFLHALRKAMPHIPVIASQGMTFETFDQYLAAGATAVVLSDAIFNKTLVNARDYRKIQQQAGAVAAKADSTLRLLAG
ncbi:hypothetical protein L7F22_020701 [Adiantum nelumboides]|nr:hypothetical protein [Adiantum nelumboides]